MLIIFLNADLDVPNHDFQLIDVGLISDCDLTLLEKLFPFLFE